MDRDMKKPLWEKVPGLEKQTLMALIEYNKQHNKDNSLAEARLAEVLAEEASGKAPSFRKNKPTAAVLASVPAAVIVTGKPIA